MTITDSIHPHPRHLLSVIIRAILCANFFLLALFVIPVTHHWVDRAFLALRTINLEETVGRSIEFWIPASTIIVTVLFSLLFWKNRRATLPIGTIRSDGILLLAWWIALLGLGAYGFMLGMGG